MTDSLPPGGLVLGTDELTDRWADAWRPEQAAERLGGFGASWCVAAGWALDLFLGRQTRPPPPPGVARGGRGRCPGARAR
ncbi:hypothetical protein ACFWXO_28500, partial [Kitasatospora sp. NPDC059088]